MNAAQVVSVMTENQSTELIALRFMVGRPNAARIANGGSSGSRMLSCRPGLISASKVNMATKASGSTICRALRCRRQA